MAESTAPVQLSRGKLWTFRAVTAGLVFSAGIFVLEASLRWRQTGISRSDSLDPGLVRYDPELGWNLAPGWSGRHRHHDYQASYRINAQGMRHDPAGLAAPTSAVTLVVGDSFTFGLGVGDEATFVHHLQVERPEGTIFLNGAVPGYSTDQELLLLEQRLPVVRPARVLLMVYVGNDLFDNRQPFPLQVSSPKPYFVVSEGSLSRRNQPVPLERKPRDAADLMTAVWGPDPAQWPWRVRAEQRSELFRMVSQSWLPTSDQRADLEKRFAPELRLFDLLLQRFAAVCSRQGVKLVVAPLAGRSYVNGSGLVAWQYQEVFRNHVVASSAALGLPVIDVASRMRTRYQVEKTEWFFPNEGHLNEAGHRVVADILRDSVAEWK